MSNWIDKKQEDAHVNILLISRLIWSLARIGMWHWIHLPANSMSSKKQPINYNYKAWRSLRPFLK